MWRLATSSFVLLLTLLTLPLAARALTVSPVRLELDGDPGQLVTGEFKIFNEQKETQIFYTNSENFEAQGENGNPAFVGGGTDLASWITVPAQVSVRPGEIALVPFTITIPRSAEAGGHFAAIFLGTQPAGGNHGPAQVSITGKVGILVLLRVNGAVREGGGLLEFDTKDAQRVFSSLPVNLFYRFQNSGSDRIKPSGTVTIKNLLGMKSATLDANRGTGNILPRSIRRFELVWDKSDDQTGTGATPSTTGFFGSVSQQWQHFALGRYTAELSLAYGSTEQTVQSRTSFWVLPWQLLLVIVIIVVVGGGLLVSVLRRYNRWIIKRASLSRRGR